MNRSKIRKRCQKGHAMELSWRSCPKCTDRQVVIRAARPDIVRTVIDRLGPHGADRTVLGDPELAAVPAPSARLVALTDSVTPKEIALSPGRTKLGKTPTESQDATLCEISGDAHMSRNHAVIEIEGDRVTITDSKSLNGTLVNGDLIDRATLNNGDTIQMGESTFRFEYTS